MHFNESHKEKKISFSSASFDTNLRKVFIGIYWRGLSETQGSVDQRKIPQLKNILVKDCSDYLIN